MPLLYGDGKLRPGRRLLLVSRRRVPHAPRSRRRRLRIHGRFGCRTRAIEAVCTGTTGHAEAVRVDFDPEVIPREVILDVFFTLHDPTQLNRQGADVGPSTGLRCSPRMPRSASNSRRRATGPPMVAGRHRHHDRAARRVPPGRGVPSGLLREEPRAGLLPRRRAPEGRTRSGAPTPTTCSPDDSSSPGHARGVLCTVMPHRARGCRVATMLVRRGSGAWSGTSSSGCREPPIRGGAPSRGAEHDRQHHRDRRRGHRPATPCHHPGTRDHLVPARVDEAVLRPGEGHVGGRRDELVHRLRRSASSRTTPLLSVRKGERVVVHGRLRLRAWENGEKSGTAIEIEADSIGHDLAWGTTTLTKVRVGREPPPTVSPPMTAETMPEGRPGVERVGRSRAPSRPTAAAWPSVSSPTRSSPTRGAPRGRWSASRARDRPVESRAHAPRLGLGRSAPAGAGKKMARRSAISCGPGARRGRDPCSASPAALLRLPGPRRTTAVGRRRPHPLSPAPVAPPTLRPELSADENLAYFDSVNLGVVAANRLAGGRDFIDALVAAGFDRAQMQVTADRTTVDLQADSVQFAVLFQGRVPRRPIRPRIRRLPRRRAARARHGGCLVGQTRPIDW